MYTHTELVFMKIPDVNLLNSDILCKTTRILLNEYIF